MGKISDALERHQKESKLKGDRVPLGQPVSSGKKELIPSSPAEIIKAGKYSPKLVVLLAPDSMDAENFKILRSQILFPKDGKRPRVIMVTSALPGEGKTFVASNLAVSIALSFDEYVLLVDCDFRRPTVHRMLGISVVKGLHEHLMGQMPLEDLILKTGIGKLSVLTAGNPSPNPSELLASRVMRNFLEEVKNRYDDRYIIIDATPAQVTSEANVLSQYVDGIIFVVMAERAPKEAIQRSIDNLGKEKILGVVFNGYNQSYRGYRKYYKKYYKHMILNSCPFTVF